MSRIVYLNGQWLPEDEAKVSIFDRAFLMGDAIYEVTCVLDGMLLDYPGHAARLRRSAAELGLTLPLDDDALLAAHHEIVARNGMKSGMIYLQLSRGVAERDFAFPPAGTAPTLVMFTQAKDVLVNPAAETGISVALVPDLRWGRRDIKTVQLLYPSMAKMEAKAQGADDAWLHEDGFVTEASAATAHIVTAEGTLVTRDLSHALLPGVTRGAILELAAPPRGDGRGTRLHPGRGPRRARGLHHLGHEFRRPGGPHRRRADRRRHPRRADPRAARAIHRHPPGGRPRPRLSPLSPTEDPSNAPAHLRRPRRLCHRRHPLHRHR
jgi:D-alanine transaminase